MTTSTVTFDMKDSRHQIPPLELPTTLGLVAASVRIASHVYPHFGRFQRRKWTTRAETIHGGAVTGYTGDAYPFTITPPLVPGD